MSPIDAKMNVQAPYQSHGQIAAAVSWLCAALRNSPNQELSRSFVTVKVGTKQDVRSELDDNVNFIHFESHELQIISNPATCWHSLFPHNVIAQNHSIRPRLKGKGLEISFANLANASRCLSFVEYEDGLIAHGLKSVLIPTSELVDDDAIQWHFKSKAKQRSSTLR